jgi:hypothetical protein
VIGSAIPRIGSSNALGYDTSTGCRLSRLDHLIKRFPHLCRFGLTLAGFPVGAGAAGWHHARPAARAAVRRRGRIHYRLKTPYREGNTTWCSSRSISLRD